MHEYIYVANAADSSREEFAFTFHSRTRKAFLELRTFGAESTHNIS